LYFVCNQRAGRGFTKPGQFTRQLAEFDPAATGFDATTAVFNSATAEYSAAVALTGADQAAAAEHLCYFRSTCLSNLSIRISRLFILRISDLPVHNVVVSIPRVFTALLLSPLVADYCRGGAGQQQCYPVPPFYIACRVLCASPPCKWIISFKSDIYQQAVKHNQNCSSILNVK